MPIIVTPPAVGAESVGPATSAAGRFEAIQLFGEYVNGRKWTSFSPREQKIILTFLGFSPEDEITEDSFDKALRDKIQALEGTPHDVTPGGGAAGAEGFPQPPKPPAEDEGIKKGLTVAQQRARRATRLNLRAGFFSLLQTYGINVSPNVLQLIQEATKGRYDLGTFTYYLRQTPEYRKRFIGIFDKGGNPKMDELTYIQYEQEFEGIGAQYGINVGQGRLGYLFRNDVTPTIFAERAPAITQLRTNKDLYRQFGRALVQEGVAKPKDVSKEGLFKFVLGEANKEWYDVWNLARARYLATEAGIKLNKATEKYLTIRPQQIEKISEKGLSDEALAAGFSEVAEGLTKVMPLSEARTYGVTKKDIIAASFGGAGAARAKLKIERAIKTKEAFEEERAKPQTFAAEGGEFGVLGAGFQRRAQSD